MVLIPQQLMAYGLDQQAALGLYGTLTGMALPLILFPLCRLQFRLRAPDAFCSGNAGAWIPETDTTCHRTVSEGMYSSGQFLFSRIFLFRSFSGAVPVSQPRSRNIYPHTGFYLPVSLYEHRPYRNPPRTGKKRRLSDTQRFRYPASYFFCHLCHTSFRDPGIYVRDPVQRTSSQHSGISQCCTGMNDRVSQKSICAAHHSDRCLSGTNLAIDNPEESL